MLILVHMYFEVLIISLFYNNKNASVVKYGLYSYNSLWDAGKKLDILISDGLHVLLQIKLLICSKTLYLSGIGMSLDFYYLFFLPLCSV